MNSEIKISVIIPIYGAEKYIHQCLNSILNQTLKDIEIILVDDGSRDNCPKIIDEYAKKDTRIRVIHKKNSGYGASVNLGLEHASGKYISIVEPDDFIEKSMFGNLYKLAENTQADITKSAFFYEFEIQNYKNTVKFDFAEKFAIPNGNFNIQDCPEFLSYHPSIWSAIYRRDFLSKYNIKLIEAPGAGWTDNPFQVETMCLAKKITYTPEAYYHWRVESYSDNTALKDYTIPLKRGKETHAWLNRNNFSQKNILKNLYLREFFYVNIILSMKGLTTIPKRITEAKEYLKLMDTSMMAENTRKQVNFLNTHPYIYFLRLQIKNLIKNILKIKWNKSQKYIILFGRFFSLNSQPN